MTDEEDEEVACHREITYTPYLVPDWTIHCEEEDLNEKKVKIVDLTDENASKYDAMISHVGWKKRIHYALKHFNDKKVTPEQTRKLNCLLANVISTVIVLARDGTVTNDYLVNTYLYLRKVRDEFGDYPPNIGCFVDLLKSKAPEDAIKSMNKIDFEELEKLPGNVVITRIPRDTKNKKDEEPKPEEEGGAEATGEE